MTFASHRFNSYLAAALALLFITGCSTFKKKEKTEFVHLELHLEVERGNPSQNESVPIFRSEPVYVNVEKEPFLENNYLEAATVVADASGFAIQLKYSWQGTALLDSVTSLNRNRRVAVQCTFGKESRWLAAPVIRQRISNGVISFTPDATREEADRIVRDLNAMIQKAGKDDKL